MLKYRCYAVGSDGHINAPSIVVECADDCTAVAEARKLADGRDIEVWQGKRLVTYLVPDSTADEKKP